MNGQLSDRELELLLLASLVAPLFAAIVATVWWMLPIAGGAWLVSDGVV